jgi:hypothetical protein
VSIFDTEQLIRSASYLGWWSEPERLLEHRERASEPVDVTSDVDDLAAA